MVLNRDFKDLLYAFSDEEVEFLIVGAYAVMHYSEPRYTKGLDVWIRPTPANAKRVMRALARFGAPLGDIGESDFADPDLVYQIGVAPVRIDILTAVAGLEFGEAYSRRVEADYAGAPLPILSKPDLIAAKRASARPQDLLDIERMTTKEEEKDQQDGRR